MKKGFWIVVILLLVSISVNVWFWASEPESETIIKRDTVWKDTAINEPQPAETINTGRVVYLRIPIPGKRDTLRDTIRDSIEVQVPIVQKRYDDSLYTAWVSGFHPNLDSIRLHQPEIMTTATKYIEKPPNRLIISPSVGAGYGVLNGKPDIYVGIAFTLNLGKRKK